MVDVPTIDHEMIGNLEKGFKLGFWEDVTFKVLCAAALYFGSTALFGEEVYIQKPNKNYNIEVIQDTTSLDTLKTPLGYWVAENDTSTYIHYKK